MSSSVLSTVTRLLAAKEWRPLLDYCRQHGGMRTVPLTASSTPADVTLDERTASFNAADVLSRQAVPIDAAAAISLQMHRLPNKVSVATRSSSSENIACHAVPSRGKCTGYPWKLTTTSSWPLQACLRRPYRTI